MDKAKFLVIAILLLVGIAPMSAKVKLTPNIVFDGKGKDKLPYGEGILRTTVRDSVLNPACIISNFAVKIGLWTK